MNAHTPAPDWSKIAKSGDRIVCVNASCENGLRFAAGETPIEGDVYTIQEVFIDSDGEILFDLVEIQRAEECVNFWLPERIGYAASRFRPVQPRKTDISWATDMLKTTSKPLEVV